jgi:Alkylmercury lyase
VTADIETAVHYRYLEPLLATGRIPNSHEVAKRLGVPIEEVRRALRGLADTHGVVLHTHVCEPWVIHPFSASPTATWVESGDRGWWATCMWCACGIATLVGGNAAIHTRIGGEREDIDIHVEKGRVRESDLWVHFAVPPRVAWDCVHHFCATVLPFRSPDDVRTWSERHGIPLGACADLPDHGPRQTMVRASCRSGLAEVDRARSRRDLPQSRARRRILGHSRNRRRILRCR